MHRFCVGRCDIRLRRRITKPTSIFWAWPLCRRMPHNVIAGAGCVLLFLFPSVRIVLSIHYFGGTGDWRSGRRIEWSLGLLTYAISCSRLGGSSFPCLFLIPNTPPSRAMCRRRILPFRLYRSFDCVAAGAKRVPLPCQDKGRSTVEADCQSTVCIVMELGTKKFIPVFWCA